MNEVALKEEKKSITSFLTSPAVRENIESVLGKSNVDSFVSDVVACVQNNEKLAECSNKSIFSGALLAKSINLPLTPQLGYAYLVPYDNKKQRNGKTVVEKEAQFQMGWKGYVQLALRSNNYRKLLATDVRKGEIEGFNPFEDLFEMKPLDFDKRNAKDDKGNYLVPIIGYYAKMEMVNGFTKELYMTQEEMLDYAQRYSKAYRSDLKYHNSYSFWTTKFDDMAKKTMLRQLLGKWGLLTAELERAYRCDMAVIDEEGNPDYVDNKPDDKEPVVNPFTEAEVVDVQEVIEIPATIEKEAEGVFK